MEFIAIFLPERVHLIDNKKNFFAFVYGIEKSIKSEMTKRSS
jgi:hypothetical protein